MAEKSSPAGPRVVVTGLGAVSAFGRGVEPLWRGLLAGRPAFRELTLFDATPFRNRLAGVAPGYDPPPPPARPPAPRALRFLLDAGGEAVRDAGLDGAAPELLARTGLVLGTNFGAASELFGRLDAAAASHLLDEYYLPGAAAALARAVDCGGPRVTLSLSCASGTAAIVTAAGLIRAGRAERVLAAGFDELSLFSYAGLSALHAITPEMIRPFDRRRAGTLFGEGAGALVLEAREAALARRTPILAEYLGGAMNNDAYHLTAPEQTGAGIKLVMRTALVEAGVAPEEIEHVNAHATGTPLNDRVETLALHEVFGDHAAKLTIAANKSVIGHAMGAAGALESIAAILTLRDGLVPPTAGLAEPDPECDLDYVPGAARPQAVRTVLKCSYGLGGTNAAAVFRKPEA